MIKYLRSIPSVISTLIAINGLAVTAPSTDLAPATAIRVPYLFVAHMPYNGHQNPALYKLTANSGLRRVASISPSGAFVQGISPIITVGQYVYGTLATHIYSRTGPKIAIYQFSIKTRALKILWRWRSSIRNRDGTGTGLALTVGPRSVLYGATESGGTNGTGVIFAFNPKSQLYKVLHTFGPVTSKGPHAANEGGAEPCQQLAYDGVHLFGETSNGGRYGGGVLFRLNLNNLKYRILHNFHAYTSATSEGLLLQSVLFEPHARVIGFVGTGGRFGTGLIYSIGKDGSRYRVLHTFQAPRERVLNPDGMNPIGMVNMSNGTLIGITSAGGGAGMGTVFKLRRNGTGFKVLVDQRGTLKHNNGMIPEWIGHFNHSIVVENTMGGKGFIGNLLILRMNPGGTLETKIINY